MLHNLENLKMDQELRKAMYVAAAIQGILSAEAADVNYNSDWVADRAVEVATKAIQIESGELVFVTDPVPVDEVAICDIIESLQA
jgi:hypothetical protein